MDRMDHETPVHPLPIGSKLQFLEEGNTGEILSENSDIIAVAGDVFTILEANPARDRLGVYNYRSLCRRTGLYVMVSSETDIDHTRIFWPVLPKSSKPANRIA